MTAIWTTVQ